MHCDGSHLRVHICTASVLSALVGARSSNGDPILGAGDVAPLTLTVIAVFPVDDSVGVPVNSPASSLDPVTAYEVTVSSAQTAAAGIAMANSYVWNFTTGSLADIIAPAVSATTPNGPPVPINSLLSASFSKPMHPLSLTNGTFSLACPVGTSVVGAVGCAVSGSLATASTPGRRDRSRSTDHLPGQVGAVTL